QEKLLLADALMHAVVSAEGMPPASHESEEISCAPDALNELLVEADLSDFHGGDHHDDECPVCRAIKKVDVLISGVAPASHESEQRQEALSIVLNEIGAWEEDERVNYPDDEVLESLDRIRDALVPVQAMRGVTSEVQGLAPAVWNDEYQAKAL